MENCPDNLIYYNTQIASFCNKIEVISRELNLFNWVSLENSPSSSDLRPNNFFLSNVFVMKLSKVFEDT